MAAEPITRSPTLTHVLEAALDAALAEVRVALPGKVTRYDASTQEVDVKPLVKQAYLDEEGARQVEAIPVIASVPVAFPGANGFRLTLPIAEGDTGTLLFSAASLDRWLAGQGQEVDPEIDARHGLGDAIFLPGLKPFGAPWSSAPTDHATIGADEGVQMHFRSSVIVAGDESGAQFVALANKVLAELQAIATKFNAHTHVETGGTTNTIIVAQQYTAGSVAATQFKAK